MNAAVSTSPAATSLTPSASPWPRRAAALLLAIAWATPASAALVPGSEPKAFPPNPAQHQAAIRREAADAQQSALIAAAEVAPPSPDKRPPTDPPSQTPVDPKTWWYKEALGLRIPFALTSQALAYYQDVIQTYAQQTFKRYTQPSSRLDYHASVTAHPSFSLEGKTYQNVKVVTLDLSFTENFAATSTEGLHFVKQRLVIFDAAGKILHISGDGPTEVPILAI